MAPRIAFYKVINTNPGGLEGPQEAFIFNLNEMLHSNIWGPHRPPGGKFYTTIGPLQGPICRPRWGPLDSNKMLLDRGLGPYH